VNEFIDSEATRAQLWEVVMKIMGRGVEAKI
jgi:hypothetical protein